MVCQCDHNAESVCIFNFASDSHLYYMYHNNIVSARSKCGSDVYSSLFDNFAVVIAYFPMHDLEDTLHCAGLADAALSLHNILTVSFILDSFVSDELWDHIFSFLDQPSLMMVHLVFQLWSILIVKFSHHCI